MSQCYSTHSSMCVIESSQYGIIGPFQTMEGATNWLDENKVGLRRADKDEYFDYMDRDDVTYTIEFMSKDWTGETILG